MKTAITSEALLELADNLAHLPTDPAHPTTVHLRRAVSSAYYALFHGLIKEATIRTFGDALDREVDRNTLGRWYTHGEIRAVCQWVVRLSRGESVPDRVAAFLYSPPTELVEVARAFISLQEARHEADYDHAADLAEADAEAAINHSRDALAHLPNLKKNRTFDNYLVLLLGGPKLASR